MEQEQLPSPGFPNSPKAPVGSDVLSDLASALDTLGGAVRRLESHPLASGDLPERLRSVKGVAALKEELGSLSTRLGAYEDTVLEHKSRLEAVYSEVAGEIRCLGDTSGRISERQGVASVRVDALERDCWELRESARSLGEDFLALRNDVSSLTGRIGVCEEKVVKLVGSLDGIPKAQEDIFLRVVGLERKQLDTSNTLTLFWLFWIVIAITVIFP